ncbi:hypothetical protein [Spirosoma sp.]|uniref:hypothetical protein n=1 Tax=Spirosoma sp. TaxID=1899569 RepID=UPI003B3B3A1F
MKRRYTIIPTLGLLLSPSLFRYSFAPIYDNVTVYHPVGGPMLTVVLDIVWLWVVLFGIMLSLWTIRQFRKG